MEEFAEFDTDKYSFASLYIRDYRPFVCLGENSETMWDEQSQTGAAMTHEDFVVETVS